MSTLRPESACEALNLLDIAVGLKTCPGAFFGIGAGEDHPPFHTEHYEYPDSLPWMLFWR